MRFIDLKEARVSKRVNQADKVVEKFLDLFMI